MRIDLPMPINRRTVEKAHAMAIRGPQDKAYGFMQAGMRAARAQDPKLLLAMDKAANVMDALAERQQGRTRRDTGTVHSNRVESTEVQLWREAYRLCDEGVPLAHFGWIYAAAAWLAGLHEGISHY